MQWKNICLVSMAGCLLLPQSGCAAASKNIKTEENTQTQEATAQTQSHTIAIDCGEKNDGMDVVQFLKNNNVETLDYLIITHYDQDHGRRCCKTQRQNADAGI